jgi:non-specific serine/threonine protein kinase
VRTTASYLEVLAWITAEDGRAVSAAVLLAAAHALGGAVGNYASLFPDLPVFHRECEERIRAAIDADARRAAWEQGRSLRIDDAVGYALSET